MGKIPPTERNFSFFHEYIENRTKKNARKKSAPLSRVRTFCVKDK